ncbi:MAG: hypothetical protein Q4G05_00310 [Clostridia bacterium]|nr:hypothetical protein [Clostridia bacterium]
MDKKIKVQFISEIPKERIEGLYYYDIRNADMGDGYTIEKLAKVNNIGSLVSDTDLLKENDILTDEEFSKLNVDAVTDLLVRSNEIESNMELE